MLARLENWWSVAFVICHRVAVIPFASALRIFGPQKAKATRFEVAKPPTNPKWRLRDLVL